MNNNCKAWSREKMMFSEWKRYSRKEREKGRLNTWSNGMVGLQSSTVG